MDTINDRNVKIICVVEEPKNVILFEKIGSFNGLYHVLGGTISPSKGVMPEDLRINELLDRITPDVKEIILAFLLLAHI